MITNCSITLYNKYTDKTTLKEMYKRTVIKKANWQGEKESSMATTTTGKGVLNVVDSTNVYIPMINEFENKAYIEPKKWSKLLDSERNNYFTFQEADRIVKGECDFIQSALNPITNLSSYDNVISVMSIGINDYGSKTLNHFKIGGK